MDILNAKDLNLRSVERHLQYRRVQSLGRYLDVLECEPLTPFEQQEIEQIATDFQHYLYADKVSEGLIKALTIFPMLRLSGFYKQPIELKIEENVAPIAIEDGDRVVKGRYDILAVNQTAEVGQIPFWVLIAEAKNSEIAHSAGLPQLLVYGHESLAHQSSAWGLMTNGSMYQFVLIRQEDVPTYQLFTPLYLFDPNQASQLLQILKVLCKLQVPTPKPVLA